MRSSRSAFALVSFLIVGLLAACAGPAPVRRTEAERFLRPAPRADEEGEPAPASALLRAAEARATRLSSPDALPFGAPVPVGPPELSIPPPVGPWAGRVASIALDPSDPEVVYVGAPDGGLWRSTSGGSGWQQLGDAFPTQAIGAVAVDPTNPRVIYAGTGEGSSYFTGKTGLGILKSVDRGATWTLLASELFTGLGIKQIVVDPNQSSHLLAAVTGGSALAGVGTARTTAAHPPGLYRSTDAGATWTPLFTSLAGEYLADSFVTVDPSSSAILYACVQGAGIRKSTDAGATWTPLAGGLPSVPFRAAIGVSTTNPKVILAAITNMASYAFSILASTDGGSSWTQRATPEGTTQYFADYVEMDPLDANHVFLGGTSLHVSTDGGTSWTRRSGIHADHHALVFSRQVARRVYIAHDGGIHRSDDGGVTFRSLGAKLRIAQFYSVAAHPSNHGTLLGGTQDNGTQMLGTPEDPARWSFVADAGDAGAVAFDPFDPRSIYIVGIAYHPELPTGIYRSTDGGSQSSWQSLSSGIDQNERSLYLPPFAVDPGQRGRLYLGTNRLYTSADSGTSWQAVTASLARTEPEVLSALAAAPDGVWAGTNRGALYRLPDARTPAPVTGLPERRVNEILPDRQRPGTLWVGLSGFGGGHLFRTTDSGATWQDRSGDLPDLPLDSFAFDPGNPATLFVGNDLGLWASLDGGVSWTPVPGIPAVAVGGLEVNVAQRLLRIATVGRGMYEMALGAVLPPDFTLRTEADALDVLPGGTAKVAVSLVANATFTGSVSLSASVSPSSDVAASVSPGSFDPASGAPAAVTLTASATAAPGERTVTVTGAGAGVTRAASFTVKVGAAPAGAGVSLLVPVVLDVNGANATRYTSDLVLVNRGPDSTRARLTYQPAPGGGGAGEPPVVVGVGAGREWRVPDVAAFLRSRVYPLAPGSTVGSLRVDFLDATDPALVFAGSRTSTPNPNGRIGGSFGLFDVAAPLSGGGAAVATIYGLEEDSSFRSNLALVDVPGGTGPAQVSLQVVDGDTGLPAGAPIPYALRVGDWKQFNSILAGSGVRNGYVVLTRTGGGSDDVLCYGVVNDGGVAGSGTSDGSYVAPNATEGLVPVVLHVSSGSVVYTSELVLANPTGNPVDAALTFTPSAQLSGGAAVHASVHLLPGRQQRVPDVISWLRTLPGVTLPEGNQAGTLRVQGAAALVRTSNPNPDAAVGGSFGLAYPAYVSAARAKTAAWVQGLRQDAEARANVAIADARVGDPTAVSYLVDVYDADRGGDAPATTLGPYALAGGQWMQIGGVLSLANASHGYVRVRPAAGVSDFVVYGVVNDGAGPGERTSDGSFVPMALP